MNMDDLRTQLDRAGRRPVPAPRPEFVEDLLVRIQLEGRVAVSAPTPLASRRQVGVGRRLAAATTMAAAVLAIVGGFMTFRGGTGTETEVRRAQAISDTESYLKVIGTTEDGEATATCTQSGQVETADGPVDCERGEYLALVIVDDVIQSAVVVTPTTVPDGPASIKMVASALAGGPGVALSWEAADGAARYDIVRAVVADGAADAKESIDSAPVLHSTAELQFSDELAEIPVGAPVVRYRVSAIDASGETIAQTDIIRVALEW